MLYNHALGQVIDCVSLVFVHLRQRRRVTNVRLRRVPRATDPFSNGGVYPPAAGDCLLKLLLSELLTHMSKFVVECVDRLALYMIQFYCVLQYTNKGDAI